MVCFISLVRSIDNNGVMDMFCKHVWEKIVDRESPSPFEEMGGKERIRNLRSAPPWLFEKKYLIVLACTKCGKVKKIESC